MYQDSQTIFIASWIDACAMVRLYIPSLSLPGSSFFCFAQRPNFNAVAGNTVAVVQRCCTKPQFEFMKLLQAMDIKCVYDLDDNLWELPDTNPAKGPLTAAREGFKTCIQMSDVVTVSTRELAKVVKKHVKVMVNNKGKAIPIVVIPNKLDNRMLAQPAKFEDRLIVGWAGSSSHMGDLAVMEEGYCNVLEAHPDVLFEIRGCQFLKGSRLEAVTSKAKNYRFKVWSPVAEYCNRMPLWGWDIALAPLTEHVFNQSKSCLKMLEAAYCKIPCLASWVEPYDEFTSHDPELRWLLCASSGSWEPKLRELIHDEVRRKELGQRMYQVQQEYYSITGEHREWRQVLDMVVAS